jgi:hypothetical protein
MQTAITLLFLYLNLTVIKVSSTKYGPKLIYQIGPRVAEHRFVLAQKYGYEVSDVDPNDPLLSATKDPRQVSIF